MRSLGFRETILVTGGAGFIGAHLVQRLIKEDVDVVNFDKLTYAANLANLAEVSSLDNYHFVKGDVADGRAVKELFQRYQPDIVYHLAAETHVDRSVDDPDGFIKTNVLGTFELLSAALTAWRGYEKEKKRNFRFVHVSTDEVFGSLGVDGYFTAFSRYDPTSPYSASKAGGDHLARAWHKTYGLPVLVTNCSNNYGPYQHPEKLIPTVIGRAIRGKEIPIYGSGENVRDWIFAGDHADGLCAAARLGVPGPSYLFGGHAELTNNDLCRKICAILDELSPEKSGRLHAEKIVYTEDRPAHDFRYAIDCAATERSLNWRAATTTEDGLRQTISWYLSHPERLTDSYERLGLLRFADKEQQE